MEETLLVIALFKQEVGSVMVNLSGGDFGRRSFDISPITEDETRQSLQGLEREVRLCFVSSVGACHSVLGEKPEWREAEIILVDQPTVEACRPMGQSDDHPLASLVSLESLHCSEGNSRGIIGIFARDEEVVELINAGCNEACTLDNLSASIRSQLNKLRR